jgi:uncharacterized protein with LGFP repeats
MSARSFKSVGWVAGIGAAALTCYMFSLSVASERAELAQLDSRVVALKQSIRTLNTELETRGRVHQLQHWASADFGFTAPSAGQFLESEVTLAQLELPSQASPMEGPVRMADAPQPAPNMPRVVQASAPSAVSTPARPAVTVASQPRAAQQPLLRQASVTRAPAAAPAEARPAAAPRTPTSRSATPPQRATTRAASLLNERTLRELTARERSESRPTAGGEGR